MLTYLLDNEPRERRPPDAFSGTHRQLPNRPSDLNEQLKEKDRRAVQKHGEFADCGGIPDLDR